MGVIAAAMMTMTRMAYLMFSPEPLGSHDAEEGQEIDQHRQLEAGAHAQDHGHEQVAVFGDRDHGCELLAVAEKEIKRARIDVVVAEVRTAQEEVTVAA